MGHIHKYQSLSTKETIIFHLGSLDKTAFSDGNKFLLFYDDETNHMRTVPLPCRNLVDLDLSLPTDNKDATAFVLSEIDKTENLKDAIVRLRIKINAHDVEPVDKEAVESKLKDLGAFHLCSFNEVCDVDKIVTKNSEIDETIDHFKAVDLFVNDINADDAFKKSLADACKAIIKECQKNEAAQ
jgi:DNA repair exonuclease SbcCD nuclease subunit